MSRGCRRFQSWRSGLRGSRRMDRANALPRNGIPVRLGVEDSGQDLIEHALLGALTALASISGMPTVASDVNNAFTKIGSRMSNALGT